MYASWKNITSIILNLLYFLLSLFLVMCYLFFFGCCVSVSKIKIKEASDSVEDLQNNDCLEVFRIQLENYSKFKDSVSFGLFLIFTLQTIQAIFFIFNTIQMMGVESRLTSVCYVFWCLALLLIILYLGLAAEDMDQMRCLLIDNMW